MKATIFITALCVIFFNSCQFDDSSAPELGRAYEKASSLYSSNIDECERLSLQYLDEASVVKNNKMIAKFAYLLGLVNSLKGKYAKSTEYLLTADYYFNIDGDKKNSAKCLTALGYVNNSLEKYNYAITFLKKSLALNVINQDQILTTYNYLAQSYLGIGKKDSAFKIIENIILPTKDKYLEGVRYDMAGYLFLRADEYDRALMYIEKSIVMNNSKGDLAICYNNLAYIAMQRNDLEKAKLLVEKSLSFNISYCQSHALRTRAFIYIKEEKYDLAIADFNSSLKYKLNYGEIAKGYQLIAKSYEEKGDITHSNNYWKLSTQALNEKARSEAERATEADKAQVAIYDHNNKIMLANIANENQNNLKNLLIAALVISIICYFFYSYWRRRLAIKASLMSNVERFKNL